MAFDDLLYGLAKGAGDEILRQHEDTRRREDLQLAARREIGQSMLEAIMNGKGDPRWAGPMMTDMDSLMNPQRRSVGGWRGMMGKTQEPLTPTLDALTRGQTPIMGDQGVLYSPDQLAQRDQTIKDKMTWQQRKTELANLLPMMKPFGYDDKALTRMVLRSWYDDNANGVRFAPTDYLDPSTGRFFRGQLMQDGSAPIDLATNLPVPGAVTARVDATADLSGTRHITDRFSGTAVGSIHGVQAPRTQVFTAQDYGTTLVTIADPNSPSGWRQIALPMTGLGPRRPPQEPAAPTGTEPNADYVKLERDRQAVEEAFQARVRQAGAGVALEGLSGLDEAGTDAALQRLRDNAARLYGYADWADLITKHAAAQARSPVTRNTPGATPNPGAFNNLIPNPNAAAGGAAAAGAEVYKDQSGNSVTIKKRQ